MVDQAHEESEQDEVDDNIEVERNSSQEQNNSGLEDQEVSNSNGVMKPKSQGKTQDGLQVSPPSFNGANLRMVDA